MTTDSSLHEARERSIVRHVGQQLQHTRRRCGWKQDAFAEAMGLSRTTMSNIERGAQRIFVDQLYRAAAILRVDIRDLLPPVETIVQDEATVHAAADDPLTPEAVLGLRDVILQLASDRRHDGTDD